MTTGKPDVQRTENVAAEHTPAGTLHDGRLAAPGMQTESDN